MQKDTNEIKKYRKKVCENCGADCSMSPDMILGCIKHENENNSNITNKENK